MIQELNIDQTIDHLKQGLIIPEIRVSTCLQSISVCLYIPVKGQYPIMGVVSADLMNDHWWISRALVNPPKARSLGLGSKLIQKLLDELKSSPIKRIEVAPGGYESKTKKQFNFYIKNGFSYPELNADYLIYIGK
jgi:hypothetical protein